MTSRPPNLATKTLAGYRKPDRGTQPDYQYPPYASTVKRSPTQPLVLLPTSLSEVTGPLFGFDVIKANDFDLTKQHAGDPDRRAHRRVRPRARRERPAGARTRWWRSGRPTPPAATRTSATSTTRRPIRISPAPAAR